MPCLNSPGQKYNGVYFLILQLTCRSVVRLSSNMLSLQAVAASSCWQHHEATLCVLYAHIVNRSRDLAVLQHRAPPPTTITITITLQQCCSVHGGVISRHLSDFTALLYLDLMMTMALVTAAVHTSHSTLTECTLRTGFGGKQRPDKLGKSQVKHRVPTNAQAAAIKKMQQPAYCLPLKHTVKCKTFSSSPGRLKFVYTGSMSLVSTPQTEKVSFFTFARWQDRLLGGSSGYLVGLSSNITQKNNSSPSLQVRPPTRHIHTHPCQNGKTICPLGGWLKRASRLHSHCDLNCTTLPIMESWQHRCQMGLCYRGTSCFIPTSLKCDTTERCWPRTPRYTRKHSHVAHSVSTHRLKCSMIFSSRTFSGKFPTHKCLVSRTILCAPAPLSYRWVCYVSFFPCKIKTICKINTGRRGGG